MGLFKREIGRGRLRSDFHSQFRLGQIVSNSSYRKLVLACWQLVRRKAVTTLLIADHRNTDIPAELLRTDQNTFHRPFGFRTHCTGQRWLGGCLAFG